MSSDVVLETHEREYGISPSIVASAPGKVSLLGDFTEFAQGMTLSVALQKRVCVAISSRPDNMVKFYSREYNERKKTVISNLKYRKEDRWANYPKGVLASFALNGVSIEGLNISIASDVPQGIGLGSSQALCLAAAYAFNAYFGTNFTQEKLIQISRQTEAMFFGNPSDRLTLTVQSYAKENHLVLFDARTLEVKNLEFQPRDIEVVVINTRVPTNIFGSLFRKAREDCDICTGTKGGKPLKSLREFTKSELREMAGTLPESARRRSLYIVDEISRTNEAKDLWNQGKFEHVGKLMNRSHEGLRELYEVSCPEIDWLVKRLQDVVGLYGARMSGGQFGGCVVALAKPEVWQKFRVLLDEYERIFGFKADFGVLHPDQSACVDYSALTVI